MRGGRGRGRGGRGGRGSITQDLLRDNLEDLGFDQYNHHSHTDGPPPLYPAISLPEPLSITDKELVNIQKMREITKRLQASPYYLIDKKYEKDIVRYSDRYRTNVAQVNLFEYMTYPGVEANKYIPWELLSSSNKRIEKRKFNEGDIFQQLEQQEKTGAGQISISNEEGEKEESDVENEEGADELELEDDYGVDHYASDDGGGSDDDGEAVF